MRKIFLILSLFIFSCDEEEKGTTAPSITRTSPVIESTFIDCAGVPFGSALEDNCGTCDSDISNDCVQDCRGVWGGEYAMFGECISYETWYSQYYFQKEKNDYIDNDGDWSEWATQFGWWDDKNGDGNPEDPGEWGWIDIYGNIFKPEYLFTAYNGNIFITPPEVSSYYGEEYCSGIDVDCTRSNWRAVGIDEYDPTSGISTVDLPTSNIQYLQEDNNIIINMDNPENYYSITLFIDDAYVYFGDDYGGDAENPTYKLYKRSLDTNNLEVAVGHIHMFSNTYTYSIPEDEPSYCYRIVTINSYYIGHPWDAIDNGNYFCPEG